jgi:hypothetical protein
VTVTSSKLVESAVAALRSIAQPPEIVRSVREAADDIERSWQRTPFVAGLAGDLAARTELINMLAGERVLDPSARVLGCAALRVHRGKILRYKTLRADSSVDIKVIPDAEPHDDSSLGQRGDEIRGEVNIHQTSLAVMETKLPLLLRQEPPRWAFWMWPIRWILKLIHRARLDNWQATQQKLADARRKLAALEGFSEMREERDRGAREQYFAGLRIVASGGPPGMGIREVELELAGGILPEHVELLELTGDTRAGADVDAVIIVERDGFYAPVTGGEPVLIGDAIEVIPALPQVLARARALTLARRARDKLGLARAEIDVEIDRVEATFSGRLERLHELALTIDRDSFAQMQLDRMKPMISASVNAVMEHASTHMGSEIAELGAEWIGLVKNSTTNDELKAAVAKIEVEWPVQAKRIAEEVRVLVSGGAGGVARDLYAETVMGLRAYGLPEEHLKTPKRAPETPTIEILPSLANPTTFTLGGNWFAGLFKSFDARKSDIREKVHARIEHIREVAAAEILDVEPQLHGAINAALGSELQLAIDLQIGWHQQAIATEAAAIERERQTIGPLVRARDVILGAASKLGTEAQQLEAEQPAVAAAAVAAAS